MYKNISQFILFFIFIHFNLFGQISHPGKPLKIDYNGAKDIPVLEMPSIKKEQIRDEINKTKDKLFKSDVFAIPFKASYDYNNSGIWDTLENGIKIWRLGIHSPDAKSLNLIFTKYRLKFGTRLFLYNKDQSFILGAFNEENNKKTEILATSPIPGDLIYLELQVAKQIKDPGLMEIGQIAHAFKDVISNEPIIKDVFFGNSGSCNIDINCNTNGEIQQLKYSVVRYFYAGTNRCTGTLINNTRNDGRPLLLTAAHCINTDFMANTALFFFDYESPYCYGPDGQVFKSISGSEIVAIKESLDFNLLELSDQPPITYNPYYAGWNKQETPASSSYTIHHPEGDVKKISINEDPIMTYSIPDNSFDKNAHWYVESWEYGTTEEGSSGAALFNQNNQLIGSLTGGYADCANPYHDWFEKLSVSWDKYNGNTNQLKPWLDPIDANVNYINGLDPYQEFKETTDTLSNILPGEKTELKKCEDSWGYITGYNGNTYSKYAEKFTVDESKYVYGLILNIGKIYYSDISSKITCTIWSGNDYPESELTKKDVYLYKLIEGEENFIFFDSSIIINNNCFAGYELDMDFPLDTFALYITEDRENPSENTSYAYNGITWDELTNSVFCDISTSMDIQLIVFDTISKADTLAHVDFNENFFLYPNPSSGKIDVICKQDSIKSIQIKVLDLNGKTIMNIPVNNIYKTFSLDLYPLNNGLYFIQFISEYAIETKKVLIIK